MRDLKAERAEHLARLNANRNDRQHGTINGYTYGCRCDRCRYAYRLYRRSYREARAKVGA